jgi:hypothetical protein
MHGDAVTAAATASATCQPTRRLPLPVTRAALRSQAALRSGIAVAPVDGASKRRAGSGLRRQSRQFDVVIQRLVTRLAPDFICPRTIDGLCNRGKPAVIQCGVVGDTKAANLSGNKA